MTASNPPGGFRERSVSGRPNTVTSMTGSFDEQIAEQRSRLSALRDQMAAVRSAWIPLATVWVTEYWQAQARDLVVTQSDHAASLDPAELKAIKGDVQALIDSVQQTLADSLDLNSGSKLWPDLKPQTERYDEDFRGGSDSSFEVYIPDPQYVRAGSRESRLKAPPQLEAVMQRIGDTVLGPFKARGFRTYNSEFQRHSASTVYFHRLERAWTREMVDEINRYAELHVEYLSALRGLEQLESDKQKAEVSELWDGL